MSKYKDLVARVNRLEKLLKEDMQDIEVHDGLPRHLGYEMYWPTKTITRPTIRAEVDAIMEYLGIEVKATEPIRKDPEIVVVKPKDTKKKGKK